MKKILLGLLLLVSSVTHAADIKPRPVNEAFSFSAKVRDPNTVLISWVIQPNYYLYRERFKFQLATTEVASLGDMILPTGEQRQDEELGEYQIYQNKFELPVPILGLKQGVAHLVVTYQGCSSAGFCYPPTSKKLLITVDKDLGVTNVDVEAHEIVTPSTHDKASDLLASHNLLWILLGFFSFGLLLAFTPCVLPMMPILSGIIIGQGKDITTQHAFALSLTYVLGMAFTYTAAGIIIALLGANVQAAMQNPWVISMFSLLFVLLALSMFGFYELRLPSKLENRLSQVSQHQKGGTYIGAAIMGVLSSLVVSPCVTAPLVGALTYIAKTGDALLGGIALFTMSLGMGAPLLILGTSGGKLLPKAGAWMETIKTFFGVALLGVAIYLIDRIIPAKMTMFLWAALSIISAIYLGALRRNVETNWKKLWQGCGIILLVYGITLLVGASMGNDDPLQPLENLRHSAPSVAAEEITVRTVADVNVLLAKAKAQQKPVMLDFYADWCIACKVMDRTTFKDPKVMAVLKRMMVIRVDVTKNTQATKELLSTFDVIAPPTFIFYDRGGKQVISAKIIGEVSSAEFLQRAHPVLSK